ncbi:MepB family protein [Fulvivirga sp. 29W222]|uniref:MepB family protein n=1 Tax=Fulvivirga marina TaxID=2494733 RepID=A0A937FX16_9BACT|nr:MepB family protein [Fulvivirga marina]MBL6445950.1 MepB family protein [Fulvivirga marina]
MKQNLNSPLVDIKHKVYAPCSFEITDYFEETESKEYSACQFILNGRSIICRSSKITPKKVGQFVTFWKRKGNGPIEPFHESDSIDLYVVNVADKGKLGQFVFPKSILIKKGVISTPVKEGKRAIRVYPPWDKVKNKQAERTQKWQLEYFLNVDDLPDLEKAKTLYSNRTSS